MQLIETASIDFVRCCAKSQKLLDLITASFSASDTLAKEVLPFATDVQHSPLNFGNTCDVTCAMGTCCTRFEKIVPVIL